LILELYARYQQKVVVLIDEYDKPILDNLDKPEIAKDIRAALAEDCSNAGCMDLTVQFNQQVFIIEFKVVELDTTPGSALAQIKQKRYFEKYQGEGRRIYLIGVEFSRDTHNVVGFEWEAL